MKTKTIIIDISNYMDGLIGKKPGKIKLTIVTNKNGKTGYYMTFKNNVVLKSFVKILIDALAAVRV